ncbi:MAG: recombination mediator RecR [Clostridia bacterium]
MKNIQPLNALIGQFMKLAGVGNKTAQRYALSILKMTDIEVKDFVDTILSTKKAVKFCSVCGNFTQYDPCDICSTRDKSIICVVKDAKDVWSMEKVRDYNGVYHVLGGVLNPMENIGPNDIRIKELLRRIDDNVKEIIVATNPDVEGEATAMYLARMIKPLGVKVTRIAQGISVGSDLDYADEVTLTRALEDRREI